ncbi:MAG TPA: HDIG domain-containing protein [Alphaproteobacteria bacterium]|nr:HDIG domain-containing protein [Alphaproteobacteria bacterium]
MERERKGRTRPERGVRPFLMNLGLVRVAKTGEVKIAWREIGITSLLVALLTVLLLPRWQLQTPTLAVGDVAPADIKAHTDFLIEDEVSTQQKRREIEERVLPVYDYDSQVLNAIALRLDQAMRIIETAFQMRPPELTGTLVDNPATQLSPEDAARVIGLEGFAVAVNREVITGSPLFRERERAFQRALGVDLSEDTLNALRRLHYDSYLRDGVMQVISGVMQRGIISNKDLFSDPRRQGIVLRDLQSDRERAIADSAAVFDLNEAAEAVVTAARTLNATHAPAMQPVIAEVARRLLQPNITFNAQETEARKRRALEAVKPVYFQVKRGEMLIREGERVREEHIPRLKALAAEKRSADPFSSVGGTAIFATLVVGFGLLYLRHLQPKIMWDSQALLLLAVLLVGNLLAIRAFMIVAHAWVESFPVVEEGIITYALPLAAGGILVAIFFDFQVGILFSIMTSLLTGVLLRDNLAIAVLALVGNLVATFRVDQYRQRSSILLTGLYIGAANVLTLMAFGLMSANMLTWQRAYEALFGLLGGLLAAVVVSAILPLLESIFKFTTDIKLLELASLNHPLLRQLVVHAPGTYHHSMLVGTLAEAAAEAIGANALIARVGSYYHDIGKMLTPEYFVENQMGRENKHDRLSPSMSALIITAHVKDGIKLAKEYKLPQRIIDIIPQHHGTNLITYFYNKAKETEDPAVQQVQEADYRYPGPKPQTREAAIVMLADKVEAASRVLTDPTSQRIKSLVQRVINSVFMDGQLDECDLTLRDLQRIHDAFVRTLIAIYHHRIEYPTVESAEMRRRNRGTNGPQLPESAKDHPDRHADAQKDAAEVARGSRLPEL